MPNSFRKIEEFIERLKTQGKGLVAASGRKQSFDFVDNQGGYTGWLASCGLLVEMLGRFGKPFSPVVTDERLNGTFGDVFGLLGMIDAIQQALKDGMLIELEDLIFADAFADLLEQADHLFSAGHVLAAGVIGRAVLEEHLRKVVRQGAMLSGQTDNGRFLQCLVQRAEDEQDRNEAS